MQTGILNRAGRFFTGRQAGLQRNPPSRPTAHYTNSSGYLLAYDEYGKGGGYPLFYFHDAGSSRLEAVFFHRAARKGGFRLIAIDRPGVGCSEYYQSTQVSDFCQDVLHLADALDLREFGVMSFGAGGVYATTLAHMSPQRVTAHVNLAGIPGHVFNEVPVPSIASAWLHELTPSLVKIAVRVRHALLPDPPDVLLERLTECLGYTDRKILALPRVRQTLALDLCEAIRFGTRGIAQDYAMCFRKLDFKLHEVSVPTMIWQGSADRLSSRSDCEYLSARLPNARFYRVHHRGHFFFVHYMDEVFNRLRECAGTRLDLAA